MEKTTNKETQALVNLFDTYNKKVFGDAVKKTVITIQRDGGLKVTGYFTPWESWKTIDGEETAAEIAITAEELNRPLMSIAETLLHEMVHAYNYSKGVQDCSRRGAFHNKKFRDAAEHAGLIVEDNKKYGCITTGISEGTTAYKIAMEWANTHSEKGTFEKYRYQPEKAKPNKKRTTYYKYACPCCGEKITCKSARLHCRCLDCEMDYVLQD